MINDDKYFEKEFYSYIEQIEENQESFELILDGIERKVFDEINENNVFEILEKVNTNIFSLILKKHIYKELQDSNWISFSLTNKETEYPINLYGSVFFDEEPEQLFIENIKPIRINGKEKIYSMEIFKEASRSTIVKTLDKDIPHDVVVYNVGQGNCNGIINSSGHPSFYFDFGGGVFQNTKTYPGKYLNPGRIKFCYTDNPTVVLSHWDWDHMSSVWKNEHKDIKKSFWIVPKQQIGISHLKVAVDLYNRGKLLVWPNKLKFLNTNNFQIQKIDDHNKKDKNNNGLVLTVNINSKKDDSILLPADANYNLIKKRIGYIGLIATHHGASTHNCLNKLPRAKKPKNKIAYSFGVRNSFHHPKSISITSHIKKGWDSMYFTFNGHISLVDNIIKTMPCIKNSCRTNCTLSNSQ
ncbi:ComEC/Rec2 family competence protein [Halarcobacter bivalviorum]|uniref:hypothetical protein n=1 Tax=Halarcobacter bivalviorum TaxID=663364 RepID=UPI00100B4B5F|nr:hypothetical protein [Halarcobacter bivalviorum]RXK07322.1 hypothetical protein CRU97_04225 [Halarcobacter bivalviorum]